MSDTRHALRVGCVVCGVETILRFDALDELLAQVPFVSTDGTKIHLCECCEEMASDIEAAFGSMNVVALANARRAIEGLHDDADFATFAAALPEDVDATDVFIAVQNAEHEHALLDAYAKASGAVRIATQTAN